MKIFYILDRWLYPYSCPGFSKCILIPNCYIRPSPYPYMYLGIIACWLPFFQPCIIFYMFCYQYNSVTFSWKQKLYLLVTFAFKTQTQEATWSLVNSTESDWVVPKSPQNLEKYPKMWLGRCWVQVGPNLANFYKIMFAVIYKIMW